MNVVSLVTNLRSVKEKRSESRYNFCKSKTDDIMDKYCFETHLCGNRLSMPNIFLLNTVNKLNAVSL